MPSKLPYKNKNAIKQSLLDNKSYILAFFHPGFLTNEYEIIKESVEANTFRVFKNDEAKGIHYENTPSSIFRTWAQSMFMKKFFKELLNTKKRNQFLVLHKKVSNHLQRYWKNCGHCSKKLEIGYACKLVDLLFKNLLRFKDLMPDQRTNLKNIINVPLDKYTLFAIKKIWNDKNSARLNFQISTNVGMGFIGGNYKLYKEIQSFIHQLMMELEVPGIYFDLISYKKNEETKEDFKLELKK